MVLESSPVTISVLVNDESTLFTAIADMSRTFDVVANSIENLTNAVGTPTLAGFSHLNTTEFEVIFIAETLCGGLGGPEMNSK